MPPRANKYSEIRCRLRLDIKGDETNTEDLTQRVKPRNLLCLSLIWYNQVDAVTEELIGASLTKGCDQLVSFSLYLCR